MWERVLGYMQEYTHTCVYGEHIRALDGGGREAARARELNWVHVADAWFERI